MPITRTAMVDDDGTGTTGTILNNAWKQELYNQVDAFVPVAPLTTFRVSTFLDVPIASGVYGNWQPPAGAGAVVWLLQPTGAVGFTGVLAEPIGTQHLIVNQSANAVTFYNQHADATAGNKIIGPGYANYLLPVWGSIWMIYLSGNAWLLQKP